MWRGCSDFLCFTFLKALAEYSGRCSYQSRTVKKCRLTEAILFVRQGVKDVRKREEKADSAFCNLVRTSSKKKGRFAYFADRGKVRAKRLEREKICSLQKVAAKGGHFLLLLFLLVCEKSKEVVFCRKIRQRTK